MNAKRMFVSVMVTMVLFCISGIGFAENPIEWKVQILWSTGGVEYKCFEDFCKRVDEVSNGQLKITPMPAGAVVPTFETLDAVRNNILQGAIVWPGYFTGKEPAFACASDFIYAYEDPTELEAWFYDRGGEKLLSELYDKFGVVTIGFASWGVESMFTKYPVRKPEDFKGHKFRSPQGMTADVLGRLGASVVVLPGEETFSALDKGVIDGLDWATPYMNHRMGFDRAAKYFIYPENRSCAYSTLIVSKKTYEALPDNLKALLECAMREYGSNQLAKLLIEDRKAVIEMKEAGCTQITWDKQDFDRMRKIVEGVWLDWAKKSPMAKKMVDSQIEWVKFLGRID